MIFRGNDLLGDVILIYSEKRKEEVEVLLSGPVLFLFLTAPTTSTDHRTGSLACSLPSTARGKKNSTKHSAPGILIRLIKGLIFSYKSTIWPVVVIFELIFISHHLIIIRAALPKL